MRRAPRLPVAQPARRFAWLAASVGLGAAALGGCAEERVVPRAADLPPPGSVGSGQGPGAGARDGGDAEAGDAGACLEGDADVVVESGLGGALALGGTVRFAVTVEAGRLVVVQLVTAATGRLVEARLAIPARAASLRYRATGLVPGTYLVRVQVDQAGTSQVGEPGDLDGYYDGAEASPVLDPTQARPITLEEACQDGLDYGVGVRF